MKTQKYKYIKTEDRRRRKKYTIVGGLQTAPNKQMQLHFVLGFAKCALGHYGSACVSPLHSHFGEMRGGHGQ
jgi:hypothetical protein